MKDIIKNKLNILKEFMELIDEDYPTSFNMEEFKTFRTFAQRMRYCTQHLQKLASGSSRTVFKIDDKMVLKLAKNPKGLVQNETEIEWGKDGYYSQILAKTIENDTDNLWVEMELARKCKPSDFFRIMGFKIEDLWNFLTNRVNVSKGKPAYIKMDQKLKDEMDENHFVNVLLNFIDDTGSETNQSVAGDYSRLSTYGIVDRGHGDELVIIDYGLTGYVATSYYS